MTHGRWMLLPSAWRVPPVLVPPVLNALDNPQSSLIATIDTRRAICSRSYHQRHYSPFCSCDVKTDYVDRAACVKLHSLSRATASRDSTHALMMKQRHDDSTGYLTLGRTHYSRSLNQIKFRASRGSRHGQATVRSNCLMTSKLRNTGPFLIRAP
jgi:glutamate racemase